MYAGIHERYGHHKRFRTAQYLGGRFKSKYLRDRHSHVSSQHTILWHRRVECKWTEHAVISVQQCHQSSRDLYSSRWCWSLCIDVDHQQRTVHGIHFESYDHGYARPEYFGSRWESKYLFHWYR